MARKGPVPPGPEKGREGVDKGFHRSRNNPFKIVENKGRRKKKGFPKPPPVS